VRRASPQARKRAEWCRELRLEFGHKVCLAESAKGLITQYKMLKGNPSDADHVPPSRERHMKALAHVPKLYGADRGFFSEQNLASCARSGVSTVCIPRRGGKKIPVREAFEKSAAFKKGQRFRAGHRGAYLRASPRSRHEALPC
jgi:transposase, IS5 family